MTNTQNPRDNGRLHQTRHQKTNKLNKLGTQSICREKEPQSQMKKKRRTATNTFVESQTGHRTRFARHGKPNVTIAKGRDILRKYADQRP